MHAGMEILENIETEGKPDVFPVWKNRPAASEQRLRRRRRWLLGPADELATNFHTDVPPSAEATQGRESSETGLPTDARRPRSWPIIFTRGIELSGAAINADLIAPLVSSFRPAGSRTEDGGCSPGGVVRSANGTKTTKETGAR